MRSLTQFLLFCAAMTVTYASRAQVQFYQHDTSVKVIAYGRQQTLAWCGGFNNPQFSMGDLNNDGLPDLVSFEPWKGVSTFINVGTAGNPAYRYAPEYAVNFPPLISYLVLADYNCDGIPDLFHRGDYGIAAWTGYYDSYNRLCFTFYKNLFYYNDTHAGGAANAYNNPGDIPAIVDVDHDGDLDFICYDINGGWMNYYKNLRVENGFPCDSISIALKDRCWGRVYQGFYRTHSLARTCDESGLLAPLHGGSERTTHSGNTPCLFDWDMDGDYDYLDGSVSYNEMTFLKNGRIEAGGSTDSMISQDTMWQSGGKEINITRWPTAYNLDIDQDGKKDLLISPNQSGTENYNTVWFYKNYTTAGSPDWRFQSDSFLTDKMIDMGTSAFPMLFDYDKDGKLDLFVGSDGYYQSSTNDLRSRVSYYKNTSTTGNPSFTLQTKDFLNLSTYGFKGGSIAFGDIDNDGKADLVIGHTDGTLSYFKNMAASDTVTPDWQLMQLVLTDMNGDTIDVFSYAAPFIYDIDKDGKKDIIIGNVFGTIQYYQNVSTTAGVIRLKLINQSLGGAKSDPHLGYGCNSTPFIGKIDSTGVEYLLMGSNSGAIYQYTGFQTGDTTATYTMVDSQYSFIDTMYSSYAHPSTRYGIYSNQRSSVTVGDIAGDGTYGLLVGSIKGGVEYYKRKVYTPIVDTTHHGGGGGGGTGGNVVTNIDEHGVINIYPNPTHEVLNISWSGILEPRVQISFVNMQGQTLYTTELPASLTHTALPVTMLPSGMYVCVMQSGTNRYYNKFTVIR